MQPRNPGQHFPTAGGYRSSRPATAAHQYNVSVGGQRGEEESQELYAKVMQPLDESCKRYLIHFTWVPPDMQVRLQWLMDGVKGS